MAHIGIRSADRPGDLGWIVMAQGAAYAAEHDWNAEYEGLVARIVADFAAGHDPAREAAWIAEADGERAGSIALVADGEPGTARLRILFVAADARGLGLGARLVDTCLDFARAAGYERVVLWTASLLDSARRIYEANGFTLVKETPFRGFGHDLTGQDWVLELDPQ
ncbi:GNAT family N-acetyltransferase [Glycomyces scopariae]|uniref:Acetyltransferase (GNAT) family protein n=1 Tax=Glycomyces sambucus TaxID=380244 RepID=A0A1G9DG47_9ACTN|nr:GNAT family N-acetyltransferase [Glycomyces sambucus]SDK62857.1 Acetyltransferase (GNAT) family protein [Glycomyces sambucus]